MTVSTTTCLTLLAWTGVETTFAPGFPLNDPAHLVVYSRDDTSGLQSLLTLGVHYSVSVNPSTKLPTVTRIALPAAPKTLIFTRATPGLQPTSFDNLADFAPQVHTDLHDRAAMTDDELLLGIARAPKLALGGGSSPDLPSLAALEGGVLGVVGGAWVALAATLGLGTVLGPVLATNNALAVWSGTTGTVLQDGAGKTVAGNYAWSGTQQHSNTVSYAPPSGLTPAQNLLQNLTGNFTGVLSANSFTINSDNVNASSGVIGWNYGYTFGGAASFGNRFGLKLQAVFSAADSGGAFQAPSGPYYIAFTPSMTINAANGGTGVTSGTARGAYQVANPVIVAAAGATNLYEILNHELNIALQAGASAYYKAALALVPLSTDAVQGSGLDALLVLSANTGAVGIKYPIYFTAVHGQVPYNASSTLIKSDAGTAAIGIDWSAVTFNSQAIKLVGFSVDGIGQVAARNLTLGTIGTVKGLFGINGLTSGTITFQPQDVAGTYNWNWPTGAGSAGQPMLSQGGGVAAMTFGTLGPAAGGTGIANNAANTITFSGNFGLTLTLSGATAVTLPTAGTVATLSNNLGQFAATSSAQLAGAISDETGTGKLVFASSPTFSTAIFIDDAATPQVTLTVSGAGKAAFQWFNAGGLFLIDAIGAGGAVVFRPNGSTESFRTLNGVSIGTATDNGAGTLLANKSIKSQDPTAGIGYATGAGGTVTQATSKSTGVTLNKVTGQVTMNNAALASATSVSFTLTNSAIAATDTIDVCVASAASVDSYNIDVTAVAAGSCRIQVRNFSAGSLSEALVLNFNVLKGVAA